MKDEKVGKSGEKGGTRRKKDVKEGGRVRRVVRKGRGKKVVRMGMKMGVRKWVRKRMRTGGGRQRGRDREREKEQRQSNWIKVQMYKSNQYVVG